MPVCMCSIHVCDVFECTVLRCRMYMWCVGHMGCLCTHTHVHTVLVYKELITEDCKMTLKSSFISSNSFLRKTNNQAKIMQSGSHLAFKKKPTQRIWLAEFGENDPIFCVSILSPSFMMLECITKISNMWVE